MTRPFLISFIFIAQVGWSQATITPEQDSIIADIKRRTRLDYQNMLQQLEIVEVRPGANGNDPKAPNAANYNEAKANPYPEYPDPLVFNDGSKVSSAKDWHEKRRQEILEDFDSEVYGRLPDNIPAVTWKVIEEHQGKMGDIATTTKKLIGHAGNSQYPEINVGMEMSVTVPANTSQAVPLILQFSFSFPPWFPKIDRPGADQWKEDLLNEGWGYAEMKTITIQDDNGAGLTQGIIGLVNKGEPRTSDQWGALRAWAWGAGRALDYFETDAQIDEKKAGITGHSRFGKAALVTMAYDPRFAIGYISSSGAGGASPHRRNYGEIVENVAGSGEYHWMAGNYIKYAGPLQWDDLPVDSHELIALCAPRPVFIGSGNEGDEWVDPKGMFMAAAMASPVYELLGKKGLGVSEFPQLETPLISGDIGFRQHGEGHTPAPNWSTFIQFAKKYFD